MNSKAKILAAGIMIAVLGMSGVRKAHASDGSKNPDFFTLSVTIGNQKGIHIEQDNGTDLTGNRYAFSTLNLGQASINTSNINIDNDSGGLTQSYQLSILNNPFAASNMMDLRETTGGLSINEYRVQALFQDAQPAHGDFLDNDILTTTAQAAALADGSDGVFTHVGMSDSDQDGLSITDGARDINSNGAEVRLWLRLELAATMSGGTLTAQTDFAMVFVNAI